MNSKAMMVIVGTLILLIAGVNAGFCGATDNVDPSLNHVIYGAFVDNYIEKCEAKAEMLDSGSVNIRKNALRSTVKGAYVKSNRTSMIEYLVDNNVPFSADRIAYHLNQNFTQSVHPQKVYALLLQEHLGR